MSVIPFRIPGIQRVTGVVVTQNIAGHLEREVMVRVRFESGHETTTPLLPTMRALLDLEHPRDTIGRVIVRECLDAGR